VFLSRSRPWRPSWPSTGPKGASEGIKFICPPGALKQFVNVEITNQQLLDQSFILVNGVRIALKLQLVE
jgi:hypothetical protein